MKKFQTSTSKVIVHMLHRSQLWQGSTDQQTNWATHQPTIQPKD